MIDFGYGARLEALNSDSVDVLRHWRNDYAIWKWCRQNDLISDMAQRRWIESQDKDPRIHMYEIWDSNEIVGVCGFTDHNYLNRNAEFSLYIGPEHQGKGLGRAALKTLVSHGFLNLNLHVIWGESFEGNPALKMFKDLGFKSEGMRRDFYFKDGRFISSELISLLEDEWVS